MTKNVTVYVFSRTVKKHSNVYKIVVNDEKTSMSNEDILKCDGQNFTLNPSVAMFIAHSEAQKLGQSTFTVKYIDGVADFSGLKPVEIKTKNNSK